MVSTISKSSSQGSPGSLPHDTDRTRPAGARRNTGDACVGTVRCELSRSSGPSDRAIPGRFLDRHRQPRDGAEVFDQARPAIRGGNRAGASGNLGADMVAKAAPDGYTMGLITASTHGVAPALGTKLPYDPVNDFKPVSMIGA